MNQKLIKSFLLGSLSLATLVPTGVAGWKVFAAKGESKVKVEVPELPKATTTPTASPQGEEVKEQAVLGASTSVDVSSPTPTPTATPVSVTADLSTASTLPVESTLPSSSPSVSPSSSPSVSPSASPFPVASSIGTGASLGEDDRVEVEGVETHAQSSTSTNQSIHLED